MIRTSGPCTWLIDSTASIKGHAIPVPRSCVYDTVEGKPQEMSRERACKLVPLMEVISGD